MGQDKKSKQELATLVHLYLSSLLFILLLVGMDLGGWSGVFDGHLANPHLSNFQPNKYFPHTSGFVLKKKNPSQETTTLLEQLSLCIVFKFIF